MIVLRTVLIGIVLTTGITAIPVRDRITDNPGRRGRIADGPVRDSVTENNGRVRMSSINGHDHMIYNHCRDRNRGSTLRHSMRDSCVRGCTRDRQGDDSMR